MIACPPRLLVVTPTLGTSPWLDETVASVAHQSLDVVHILSAPTSQLAALAERYPHAVVVADAGRSGGIYGALNAALAQAPAGWDWFTYINDDDLLLRGFRDVFQSHVTASSPEPVLYGDVALVEPDGHLLSRITTETNPKWIPALLQQGISPLMQQGMLFRRDVVRQLREFDQHYRLCADLDFWLRAYAAGHPFRHAGRTIAAFRLRPGQLSHDTRQTDKEQSEIVSRHLPATISPTRRIIARWRYRLWNLPRYVARFRQRGFVTSYELLERGGAS
jgi:glycosyltransferase involved in cell wall biosynthesis